MSLVWGTCKQGEAFKAEMPSVPDQEQEERERVMAKKVMTQKKSSEDWVCPIIKRFADLVGGYVDGMSQACGWTFLRCHPAWQT